LTAGYDGMTSMIIIITELGYRPTLLHGCTEAGSRLMRFALHPDESRRTRFQKVKVILQCRWGLSSVISVHRDYRVGQKK